MKKCRNCGYQNGDDAVFCENCGTRLMVESKKQNLVWLWIVLLAAAIVAVVGLVIFLFAGEDDKSVKNKEEDNVEEVEPQITSDNIQVTPDTIPEIVIHTPTPAELTPPEPTPPEPTLIPDDVPENTEQADAEPEDLEEQIQDIRDIYYGIQYNLDEYAAEENGGITGYRDDNGNIVKISVEKGTISEISTGSIYSVEYYYEFPEDEYHMRFAFIFGDGEEYRLYFDRSGVCIRFIATDGIVYDNENVSSQLGPRSDLTAFSVLGRARIIAMLEEGE